MRKKGVLKADDLLPLADDDQSAHLGSRVKREPAADSDGETAVTDDTGGWWCGTCCGAFWRAGGGGADWRLVACGRFMVVTAYLKSIHYGRVAYFLSRDGV